MVTGENDFQRIVSQMFVAMNREIPDPNPYPLFSSSSSISTMNPAIKSYRRIRTDLTKPSSPTGPYMPDNK